MTSSTSEGVLRAVETLQPGEVTTYGEIARVVGTGARYVGTVLRTDGAQVAWWRVVRADGSSHDPARSRVHWDDESIAHDGKKVSLHDHGIDYREIAQRCDDASYSGDSQ